MNGVFYKFNEGKLSVQENNLPQEIIDKGTFFEAVQTIALQLRNYTNVNIVKDLVEESLNIIKENAVTISIKAAINAIHPKIDNKAFESVYNKLNELYEKDEAYLLENFVKDTKSISWVSEVQAIQATVNSINKQLDSTREAVVEKVYSPVVENSDGSYTFYLDRSFYNLNESTLTRVDNTNGTLLSIVSMMENFKFEDNSVSAYGRNGKEMVIDLTEGKVLIEGAEVDHTNIDSFRNILLSTNFVNYNELYKVDEICSFIENIDTIKHLDFVTSLKSRVYEGVKVNIFKLEENLYINRINNKMRVNELSEAASAIDAQKMVSEYVNYDISNLVIEMIDSERKAAMELNSKKDAISETLSFLKEKKKDIESTIAKIGESEDLNKAIDLIDNEIVIKEKELQEVFDKITGRVQEKKSPEDLGFVEAEVVKPFDGFSKGDSVYVNAEEYTEAGKNDDVTYSSADLKRKGSIKKSNVEVKI